MFIFYSPRFNYETLHIILFHGSSQIMRICKANSRKYQGVFEVKKSSKDMASQLYISSSD